MNAGDIRKLRHKFIGISMISIFIVMLFVGAAINVASYFFATNSIHNSLTNLIEQNGVREMRGVFNPNIADIFNPEYNRNHYYVIVYSASGEVVDEKTNSADVEEDEFIETYADKVFSHKIEFGRLQNYFFLKEVMDDGGTVIAFLDCSTELYAMYRILLLTIAISLVALGITFLLLVKFSAKAVRPEIENNRRQKEFITNASHELKTPLAVIRANTELIEMTAGESEWTQSTLNQVERIEGLIKNLVMIARSEEQADKSAMGEVDVTKAVRETADTYDAIARQTERELVKNVQEDVKMIAEESKIRQLTTILIDNAFKYCDEKGKVEVILVSEKKGVCLTVSNSYAEGESVDYDKFFERFYRQDFSHNIDKGGYGIGLSIAENICGQYDGSIRAAWHDGVIYFICHLR